MAEQWLSIVEYARTFAVSDMTVRRRIKTGRLHAVLQEGKYFIPVAVDPTTTAIRRPADVTRAEQPATNQSRQGMMAELPTPSASARGEGNPERSSEPSFVVKNHPHAQRTLQTGGVSVGYGFSSVAPIAQPQMESESTNATAIRRGASGWNDSGDTAALIGPVRNLVEQLPGMMSETRSALAFVQQAVRRLDDAERRIADQFQARVDGLNASLRNKETELAQARQQIEDLQLLVQLMEKRKP